MIFIRISIFERLRFLNVFRMYLRKNQDFRIHSNSRTQKVSIFEIILIFGHIWKAAIIRYSKDAIQMLSVNSIQVQFIVILSVCTDPFDNSEKSISNVLIPI